MSDQIKYYFKETTNQILVSGSSTVADMNILLNSVKDENTLLTGPATANNTVKLSSLGEISTYVIDNNGQIGGDTTITVDSDQELWLYRGWQPVGTEDANAYRYNPFLHRPYKAYILTETGGGSSAFPWSPDGSTPFSNFPGGTILPISDAYDERYLASNGSQTQDGINSTAIVKGNFTVSQTDRGIHPWIFTRYSAKNATRQGSTFYIYKENTNSTYTSNYFTSLSAAVTAGQQNAVILNNTTVTSITEVTLGNTYLNTYTLSRLLTNIAQGKPAGELVFTQSATPNSTITGTITSVVFAIQSGVATYKVGLSNVTSPSSTVQYSNNSSVDVKFQNYPQYVGTPIFQQELSSATNTTAEKYPTITLTNAFYTYTSSVFDGASSGQNFGLGFSQFGLYADLNWSVRYQATNDTGNTVRIYYTDTSGTLKFYDLATGFIVEYDGLSSPVPYFDPVSPGTGFENIVIESSTSAPTAPESSFNTRVNDVYIAYSSSLSQSIDGLYVFNQIPQSDVQVTVSMYLNAWTGSDEGAKYGDVGGGINVNTTYSISPDLPHYGAGETGDRPTWTTASIRLYTGSYPNAVPDVLDDFYVETAFEDENIHISGLAITASFEIPKDSITLKKCLSVALQVSTGSNTPATDVENSLVVSEYSLEFNTPGENDNDGSVPVFLDGALSGGETLANTPDCQPLYNVYVTDETLRRNPLIQEIEYNIPEDLILTENEPLIPTQYPFLPGVLLNSATNTYTQSTGQITTSGNGVGIALTVAATNGGNGIIVTIENPGSGYKNGDMISISAQTLIDGGLGDSSKITQALEIVLNIVYGIYNPSNFRPILENAAIKSSVPESNYTQLSSITPRYLGARSTADHVNSVLNLVGGFGTLPVIDYKTAFFAYCDQVVDPYPTVNGQTLFNIKYLVNEGGDPKQPNLSPYTAFDIEGSWEEGGVGRVGINQISGSTQYDALNNLQPIGLVAKQIVPYFWSQTGNNSFAEIAIPMSGKRFNDTSNDFLQYGMTVAGNLYNANNENSKNPTLGDNFFTSATETFNNQTFNQAFNFGEFGGSTTPPVSAASNTVSHSFATGSSVENVYSEMGEMFFNNDQYAINSLNDLTIPDLSDSYTIGTDFIFPAGTPSNTNTGVKTKGNVGSIEIRLQYLDQPVGAALASWPTEVFQTYTQQIRVDPSREVEIELFYGDKDENGNVPSTNTKTERYPITMFNDGVVEEQNYSTSLPRQYIYILPINYLKLNSFLSSKFGGVGNVNFVKYHIPLQTIGNIPSNRRFRWKVEQKIDYLPSVNQNAFNPTTVIGSNMNNVGAPIYPPVEGPFFTATISGTKQFPTDDTNLIKRDNTISGGVVGYWKFFNSGIGFKNNATLTPSNSSTGTGYAIGGVATTSNLITITDAMTSTSGASGGQIALTTNTVGAFTSALLVQADSNQYATNTVITIPEFVLQNSGLNTAGTGNAIVTLTPASTEDIGTGINNILELQPESANNLYNDTLTSNPYFMGTLPYTASSNILFPGGQEPSDTSFPELGIPFQIQRGDEIRFLNDETLAYNIVTVTPPADTVNSKLRITILPNENSLEGIEILPPNMNLDFFLMRRTIPSPNTIYIDRSFPYGTLPTIKKFVDSTNQSFGDTPAFAGSSYPTQATSQGSGSFVEYTDILRKSDNTPAGILFPEFPTALIDLTPDEILSQLRDNKLID